MLLVESNYKTNFKIFVVDTITEIQSKAKRLPGRPRQPGATISLSKLLILLNFE